MGTIPEVSYTYHLLKLDPPPANSSTSPEVTNLTRQHKHNIDPEEEETGEDSAWGYGDFSACSVTCGIGQLGGKNQLIVISITKYISLIFVCAIHVAYPSCSYHNYISIVF